MRSGDIPFIITEEVYNGSINREREEERSERHGERILRTGERRRVEGQEN